MTEEKEERERIRQKLDRHIGILGREAGGLVGRRED